MCCCGQNIPIIGKPCSHASSFLRPCYAIGVYFGCFLRLMTWGKRRFSNRSTPDNARFVRRAPVGYFRIFTALHRSCSQLHVALLAARHITASGLLRLLRLGMENELYEFLDLAGRSFECRHEILCLLLQLFVFPFPYAYIAFERFHFILQISDQPARSDSLLGKLLEELRVLPQRVGHGAVALVGVHDRRENVLLAAYNFYCGFVCTGK